MLHRVGTRRRRVRRLPTVATPSRPYLSGWLRRLKGTESIDPPPATWGRHPPPETLLLFCFSSPSPGPSPYPVSPLHFCTGAPLRFAPFHCLFCSTEPLSLRAIVSSHTPCPRVTVPACPLAQARAPMSPCPRAPSWRFAPSCPLAGRCPALNTSSRSVRPPASARFRRRGRTRPTGD